MYPEPQAPALVGSDVAAPYPPYPPTPLRDLVSLLGSPKVAGGLPAPRLGAHLWSRPYRRLPIPNLTRSVPQPSSLIPSAAGLLTRLLITRGSKDSVGPGMPTVLGWKGPEAKLRLAGGG